MQQCANVFKQVTVPHVTGLLALNQNRTTHLTVQILRDLMAKAMYPPYVCALRKASLCIHTGTWLHV